MFFVFFRSAIPLTNCWSRSIIARSWSRSSRLSSRSKSPNSQKTNTEYQWVPKRNSSILMIRMKENTTVQISIMVKQNNRTKTSDAIIWWKKWRHKLRFLLTILVKQNNRTKHQTPSYDIKSDALSLGFSWPFGKTKQQNKNIRRHHMI